MKSKVIREMTQEEIQDALSNERESLDRLRMQHAISPLENPIVLRDKRKVVARLLTELSKRTNEVQH